jgi:LysR family transcriptional regulator, transcription activator of glutamate synthase operon
MELRHLVYFEAVARHSHVSRAATELSIAQPAISKQLHDLERELGAGPLFERVGRRLRLTETGHAFLAHARAILAQVDTARAEMRERAGLRGGRVTIGAPPTVGERLLPGVLAEFHRRYPDVELRMHEGGTPALLRLLDSGEVDIAVVTLPIPRHGLRVTPLFAERLVVVVAQGHRLASRRSVAFEELAEEPFLLYEAGGSVRDATLAACRAAGFTPRVVLHGGSLAMLLRLAEAGLGIAVIPPLALTGSEPLAALRIRGARLERTMALVSREGHALPPATLTLRAFLEERLVRPDAAEPEVEG